MSNNYSEAAKRSDHPLFVLTALLLMVFFFNMVGSVILSLVFGNDVVALAFSQKNREMILLLQGVSAFFSFVLVPVLFFRFYWKENLVLSLFSEKQQGSLFLVVSVLFVVVSPFISFLAVWNEALTFPSFLDELIIYAKEKEMQIKELTLIMLGAKTWSALFWTVFVVAVIPAVGEELLFRGIIQRVFVQYFRNPYLAIVCSGMLFSLFHFQLFGFFPRAALGILLGLLFYWSGNLAYAVFFHFLNNSSIVFFFYLYNIGIIDINIMDSHGVPYLFVLFSSVITVFLLIYFRNISVEGIKKELK